MRILFFSTLLCFGVVCVSGCSPAGDAVPQKTELSEIDQYLADNPDHVAQQAAIDAEADAEDDINAATEQ